jgi:hypothetical protein
MSDADFNSNLCRRPPSSSLLLPPGGSNRNSTVSTYRGSECSVRITANPLAVADDNGNVLNEDHEEPAAAAAAASRSEARNDVESGDGQKKVGCVKTTAVVERACGPGSVAWSTMSREEQLRELEEVVASGGSVTSWNYEDFGMTYGELMEYFDNLKESTA